jgi:hypothetical protein
MTDIVSNADFIELGKMDSFLRLLEQRKKTLTCPLTAVINLRLMEECYEEVYGNDSRSSRAISA